MASDEAIRRVATAGLGVCLLAFVGAAALVLSPALRARLGGGAALPAPYGIGERIDVSPTIYSGAPLTLLIFGRSTCSACEASVPSYREAVAAARGRDIPAWFLTPLADLDPERLFAQRLGIDLNRVVHVEPATLRLQTVPVLALVDRHGTLRHIWTSVPDDVRHGEILKALAAAGSGSQ